MFEALGEEDRCCAAHGFGKACVFSEFSEEVNEKKKEHDKHAVGYIPGILDTFSCRARRSLASSEELSGWVKAELIGSCNELYIRRRWLNPPGNAC